MEANTLLLKNPQGIEVEMMNSGKHLAFLIGIFSLCFSANADEVLVGWENFPSPYVSMTIQSVREIREEGSEQTETSYQWQQVFLDIQNNRAVQYIFEQEDKPSSFRSPHVVVNLSELENNVIQHKSRQVMVLRPDLSRFSSNSIIFAGRAHQGKSLSSVIQSASDQFYFEESAQQFFASIGTPHFSEELTLALNSQELPIGIEQGIFAHAFQWSVDPASNVPYVAASLMEFTNSRGDYSVTETVHEFKTYDSLPDSHFIPRFPRDYTIRDMRGLLQAPSGL